MMGDSWEPPARQEFREMAILYGRPWPIRLDIESWATQYPHIWQIQARCPDCDEAMDEQLPLGQLQQAARPYIWRDRLLDIWLKIHTGELSLHRAAFIQEYEWRRIFQRNLAHLDIQALEPLQRDGQRCRACGGSGEICQQIWECPQCGRRYDEHPNYRQIGIRRARCGHYADLLLQRLVDIPCPDCGGIGWLK